MEKDPCDITEAGQSRIGTGPEVITEWLILETGTRLFILCHAPYGTVGPVSCIHPSVLFPVTRLLFLSAQNMCIGMSLSLSRTDFWVGEEGTKKKGRQK